MLTVLWWKNEGRDRLEVHNAGRGPVFLVVEDGLAVHVARIEPRPRSGSLVRLITSANLDRLPG